MLRAHKVKQLELRLLLGLGNMVADTWCSPRRRGAAVAQQCDAELVARPSNKRLPQVSFQACGTHTLRC